MMLTVAAGPAAGIEDGQLTACGSLEQDVPADADELRGLAHRDERLGRNGQHASG